jgi:hypothetical protein
VIAGRAQLRARYFKVRLLRNFPGAFRILDLLSTARGDKLTGPHPAGCIFDLSTMSLLTQLAKQAEQRKQTEASTQNQQAERESAYATLEVKLAELAEYLRSLTGLLKDTQELIQQSYDVPGYGTVQTQFAHDYRVTQSAPIKNSVEVKLEFSANILPDAPVVQVHGLSRFQSVKAVFDKHRISGVQEIKKDASGVMQHATLKARGKLTLSITAYSDINLGSMRLLLSNIEDLTESTKSFSADQVNEKLFDMIGHYITRRDNELTREKLSNDVLKKLRNTAQQNEMRRKWEEKLMVQAAAEEEARLQAEKQAKLHNRLLSQGKSLLSKLQGLLKKDS